VLIVLAAVAAVLVTRSPPILIEAVAGLALIGAFGSATLNAVQDEQDRLPGLATFLATASGPSLFGIGSAFWGLVLGLLVHQIFHARQWSGFDIRSSPSRGLAKRMSNPKLH
jgi:benzoate membrane transport protein